MSSCSFLRMTLPLFLGIIVMLGSLWESSNLQAQSTGGKPTIQKKWSFKAPSGSWLGQPVLDGDSVYFVTSADHLIAIDTRTGKMRWRFDSGTGKRYSEEDMNADAGSFPAPTVSGGLVFFSSHNGTVYAIDTASGSEKWRFRAQAAWLSEPVSFGGKVFVGTDEGNLYALDTVTGSKKWSVTMPRDAASVSAPAVGAGVVVYPSLIGGVVNAFDQETGHQRWKWKQTVKEEDWLCHGMRVLAEGYRMFIGAGGCGQVAALESLTGRLAWDGQIPTQQDAPEVFLKVASLETVLAQAEDGVLYAFNSVNGKIKWKFSVRGGSWSAKCSIEAGTFYVLETDGRLSALDEDSGKRKWEARLSGQKRSRSDDDGFSPPQYLAVSSGLIYVVGPDGSLTAYGN